MNLRTGVDLVEIDRIEEALERHRERFLKRIFTPRELEEAGERADTLAGRFAAKEAVAKALGTGIGTVGWRDIEVVRGESGEPVLVLYGAALQRAAEMQLRDWSLSISHSKTHAVAMVVAYNPG